MNSSSPSRAARDVDQTDLHHARDLYSGSSRPAVLSNLLPAISAGNLQVQPSIEIVARNDGQPQAEMSALMLPPRVRDARLAFGPAARALTHRKKTNVQRINC